MTRSGFRVTPEHDIPTRTIYDFRTMEASAMRTTHKGIDRMDEVLDNWRMCRRPHSAVTAAEDYREITS